MFSNPVAIKVAALVLLGLLKMAAGLSPMLFASVLRNHGERRLQVVTSLALCFGGGVLLASCMLHMIPKLRDSLTLIEWQTSFPLAEFMVCCGFFVVFLIEELVVSATRDTNFRSIEAEMRINGKVAPLPPEPNKRQLDAPKKPGHVLILSALSLHSASEGLALTLQPTVHAVWMLLTAILIHAVVVLFGMGLKLLSDGSSETQVITYMTVSALSSTLGGGIGLAVAANHEKTHSTALATLQGLAAGAILFVTFFEILQNERKKGGFIRIFCIILGFALVAALQTLDEHHHNRSTTTSSTKTLTFVSEHDKMDVT